MDTDILTGLGRWAGADMRQTAVEGTLRRVLDHGGAPARSTTTVDRSSELYRTCVEFEAILLKQMLTAMRKTVPQDGLLDGGLGRDIFEDMLYGEYALSMAKTAGFGLADTVYRHLSATQTQALGA